jgi:hypothetical protein
VVNNDSPVDLVGMALQLGATYVARGFSGDKAQLVPLIKGAIRHGGAAFIDVISPCVAFNNHAGSTKSYDYVREHNEAVSRIDFIDLAREITADPAPGEVIDVPQPDGSLLRLRKLHAGYDPTDRVRAMNHVQALQAQGEVVTGLLYVDPACRPRRRRPARSAAPRSGAHTRPPAGSGGAALPAARCPGGPRSGPRRARRTPHRRAVPATRAARSGVHRHHRRGLVAVHRQQRQRVAVAKALPGHAVVGHGVRHAADHHAAAEVVHLRPRCRPCRRV